MKKLLYICLLIFFVCNSCKKNAEHEIANLIKQQGYSKEVIEKILDDKTYPATTKTAYAKTL